MTAPLVSMHAVTKRFPGVLALDGADLELRGGEVVGLVGKNGAGKSSLIKVLAGVERPDDGEIRIDGEPPPAGYAPRVAHRLGLGFVHQELGNFPNLSVAENVAIGTRYPRHGGLIIDRGELRQRVASVLAELEAEIDPEAPVSSLTSVQQRVVMIARALYHRLRVLVLDEPSVSLSFEEIDHLHSVVRRVRDRGHAVLYASHHLSEILDLTDRVVVMRDGRITLEGPTSEIDEPTLVEAIAGRQHEHRGSAPATAAGDRPPVLRVRNLRRPPHVHDVSFDLREGEILGIAGLVGSGRTETVRSICGADQPESGEVELDGKPLNARNPVEAFRAGVALLPENRRQEGLILDFSVSDNVTLASLPRHRLASVLPVPSRRSERHTADEMIERLDIDARDPSQEVSRLSGGNQQKVVLAKLLQRTERALIFDEPTQGVDVGAKEEIFGHIRTLAESGRGVIFISSDFAELVGLCTRVVVLREGRVTGEVEGGDVTEEALVSLAYAAPPHDSESPG